MFPPSHCVIKRDIFVQRKASEMPSADVNGGPVKRRQVEFLLCFGAHQVFKVLASRSAASPRRMDANWLNFEIWRVCRRPSSYYCIVVLVSPDIFRLSDVTTRLWVWTPKQSLAFIGLVQVKSVVVCSHGYVPSYCFLLSLLCSFRVIPQCSAFCIEGFRLIIRWNLPGPKLLAYIDLNGSNFFATLLD